MPEDVPEYIDRPLTDDEKLTAACEWSDYRRDYGTSRMDAAAQHQAFIAGWTARHLHGHIGEKNE